MESRGAASAQVRTCLECGAPYASSVATAEFCCSACRSRWNNRRLVRGSELYDLVMALRWDRPLAKALHAFTLLSRAAAAFRAEDVDERSGRRSWSPPDRIVGRRPYLRAEHLVQPRRSRR